MLVKYLLPSGSGKFRQQRSFVCNYGSGGNMARAPIFQSGKPCSKCPNGTICKRGLCAKARHGKEVLDKTVSNI